MTELFGLALELQEVCRRHRWSFCVIGGLAVQHWGEVKEAPTIHPRLRRLQQG